MTIVLATLNARYPHASFGLRSLLANLEELQSRATLLEFTIQQSPSEIVEAILARNPQILGLGVYIWNVTETTRIVAMLKRLRPELTIVLGGPEVSYEIDEQEICQLADYVISGEGDLAFRELCRKLLNNTEPRPPGKIIPAGVPLLAEITLPYHLYSDEDLAHRVLYVEASRGCPYECEFCLSALDIPVRQFPVDQFLDAMARLLERGARTFKFVDRTFNLNLKVSRQILEFFLERYTPGLFLHFEMIPDRLPDGLKSLIARFPAGSLQFEVGIQSFDETVAALISRRQDVHLVEDNLRWLRENSGVHVHADLIVGLPGESLESFAAGFDRLVNLGPHEIQVGILKRLRGTPIIRHDAEWAMLYSPHPPYEILQNRLLDFSTIQRLRRFAKFWDLVANSGHFAETVPMIWGAGSPFHGFLRFSDWLTARDGRTHGIALGRLLELLFRFLTEEQQLAPADVANSLFRDYVRTGHSDRPAILRPYLTETSGDVLKTSSLPPATSVPDRQRRHQRGP